MNLSLPNKDIAFYRSSALGDVILSSRVLEALKPLMAGRRVFWFGPKLAQPIFEKQHAWVEYCPWQTPEEVVSFLKQKKFQGAFVDLQKNPRSARVCFSVKSALPAITIKINKRRFFRRSLVFWAQLFGRSKKYNANPLHVHQLDLVLEATNVALKKLNLDGLTTTTKKPLSERKNASNQIAFAPQAGYQTKSIPVKYFDELIEMLDGKIKKETNFVLLGCGPSSEYEKAFSNLERTTKVVSTKNPLTQTCKELEESAVLVAADSAPLHIAELLGTPCAALMGPTVPDFGFSPSLPESAVFQTDLGCRPCSLHGKKECRYGDYGCFYKIDLQKIADFVFKKMESN